MPDIHDLKWLTVRITLENREELQALTEFHIDDDPYMSYGLHNNTFIPSDSILLSTEEVIPDFSKLPEIRLLISLGMSHREAFKVLYRENQND